MYKHYFKEFFQRQRPQVRDKILWTLRIIETQPLVPTEYLKHITGTHGLYEIRVKQGSDIFRIFCFFDKGKLIVLANGFHKKSSKTPKMDLEKAICIKKEYEQEK